MVDGREQRPCAGGMKAVVPVRASRRWRLGKVGIGADRVAWRARVKSVLLARAPQFH